MKKIKEAKIKADALVKTFWMKNKTGQDSYGEAVKNAIICTENTLNEFEQMNEHLELFGISLSYFINHYKEIKIELEKL